MSKGLRNMAKVEQETAIARRLGQAEANHGLGYLAALDSIAAKKRKDKKASDKK